MIKKIAFHTFRIYAAICTVVFTVKLLLALCSLPSHFYTSLFYMDFMYRAACIEDVGRWNFDEKICEYKSRSK